MKNLRLLLVSAAALLGIGQVSAQSTTTRWTGTEESTLNDNSTVFYLYNVGTGKFVTQGGGWGVQGILLYQDFGNALRSTTVTVDGNSNRIIYSGAQNSEYTNANCFGMNYPDYSSGGKWGDGNTYGPIFEANYNQESGTPQYYRSWTFTRVEDASNTETYTYYLTETITRTDVSKNITVYIGAVNGIDPEKGPDSGTNVYLGSNYATFTTEEGHQVADNLNYQWRFITQKQMEDALTNQSADAYSGLNYNISYLIDDPYFSRNRNDEFKNWKATSQSTTTKEDDTSTNYWRYDWFWNDVDRSSSDYTGSLSDPASSGSYYASGDGRMWFDGPWNHAVVRKPTFDSKANGNYGFGLFEGIGTVSQSFTAPVEGTYEVEVRGFYQGNEAKLYITDGTNTAEVALPVGSGFSKTTTNSSGVIIADNDALLTIGKALYDNENGQYTISVNLKVSANATVTIGVSKAAATQVMGYDATNDFYYDSDIVAIDNFSLRYLGKDQPFVLDEDKTSEDYMKKANYTNTAVYLHRTFTLNKWNSLVLPIDLTSAQVKQAFGEDTKLAKLNGVGTLTGGISSIDFKSVELPADGNAIEKGKLYIIKPTLSPGSSVTYKDESNNDVTNTCYSIGRRDLDGSQLVEPQGEEGASVATGVPGVKYQGTYISLAADNANAPQAKSYVFSGGKMYHITKAFAIKGFRGWLNDIEGNSAKTFSIDGGAGTVTAIDGIVDNAVVRKTDNRVYNINGQLVRANASDLNSLPAGVYIVGGKKIMVK